MKRQGYRREFVRIVERKATDGVAMVHMVPPPAYHGGGMGGHDGSLIIGGEPIMDSLQAE